MQPLSAELLATALAAGLTGLLWVPIILNRLAEMGLWTALKNPQPDVRPEADWAHRLAHAHRNALENLAVFAPLAIIVHVLQAGDGLTAGASLIFVASRVAHAVIYALGIPLLRTIAFFIGFLCQMVLLLRVLEVI
ncbi:MAPEG family protein [Roseibium sp.]|uniref:MAPEG family protein n=1 Tax=Roseibium sp. TaxID=1936156 RepID=UPI003D116543